MHNRNTSPLLSGLKLYIVSKHLAVFLACFSLTFFLGSVTFIPQSSSADSAQDTAYTDINLNINPVISLTLDQSQVDLSITPNSSGASTHASFKALVSTNNETGYLLEMNSITNETALVHTNETNKVPSTPSPTLATLPVNTWGFNYNPDQTTPMSITDYELIPQKDTPKEINDSEAPVADEPTTITLGTKLNSSTTSGTYKNTLVFTAITKFVPEPPEFFKFTIDTRMTDTVYNPETDTPENNPEHFAGTETVFNIPTRTWNQHDYEWIIDWGDGSPLEEVEGESSSDSPGIPHEYPEPNEYQVTIYSNGEADSGWFNAWGNYYNSSSIGGAGIPPGNRILALKSIDSNISNKMRDIRNTGLYGEGHFSSMFRNMPNCAGIPPRLFSAKDTSGETNTPSMFRDTFYGFASNSSTATIPDGLFDSIDISSSRNTSYMFSATFSSFDSHSGLIPSDLFEHIDTSSVTIIDGMFHSTFADFSRNSPSAQIPAGLFDPIDVSRATSMRQLFSSTFSHFGSSSFVASIPHDLFYPINSDRVVDTYHMFSGTFKSFASSSPVATIPKGIFRTINTQNSRNTSYMFEQTFSGFAPSSTNATIPEGLFDAVDTSASTNVLEMFARTFSDFASSSTLATIPEGLFDALNTVSLTDTSLMFNWAFLNFAPSSTNATIPEGLFDTIGTTNSTNTRGMFGSTFSKFAQSSTNAAIPEGLFDTIDTSSSTDTSGMFASTFSDFAPNSTVAGIPKNLFDRISLVSITDVTYARGMFSSTFQNFGLKSNTIIDINDIWGNANFASKFTEENTGGFYGAFDATFSGMKTLTGEAQKFINSKLNGVIPAVDANTFRNTAVSDITSLSANWR